MVIPKTTNTIPADHLYLSVVNLMLSFSELVGQVIAHWNQIIRDLKAWNNLIKTEVESPPAVVIAKG